MDRHDMLRLILAPVTSCWLRTQQTKNQTAPRPHDAPGAIEAGPNPDRVLIIGSGPALGWGVLTHAIALPGSLARALTLRTGRGTNVELIADMQITVSNAASMLEAIDRSRFDVVVVVLGTNDAIRLMPLAVWRERFLAVLDSFDQAAGRPHIVVAGIPPGQTILGYASRLGKFVSTYAVKMNEVTAQLCESSNATFVPLPSVVAKNALGVRDARTYGKWGDSIADAIAAQLENSSWRTPPERTLTPAALSTHGSR
jgi:lysophospholipase L1-like esterase